MSTIFIESVIIAVLILFNAVFALAEISIVSSRKARLQEMASRGKAGAQVALDLTRQPTRFLSTVQIGITLIGVLAGAFGGAMLSREISDFISNIPQLASYATAIGIGSVVLAISYVSLIVGELVPKRIGLANPERFASLVATPMRNLSNFASPIVRFLSWSTDAILWLLRIQQTQESSVTQKEISILIEQATREGVFDSSERDLVANVFRAGQRKVGAIMTPRRDIVALFTTDSMEGVKAKIVVAGRSYYPLCGDSLDDILGFVSSKLLLAQLMTGTPLNVFAALVEPLTVPEHIAALDVLEQFKKTGKHVALVVDEHGGVEGMVTPSDVLAAVVGDFAEVEKPVAVQRADGSWLVDGAMPLGEFKELLNLQELHSEGERHVTTVAGFVMSQLGKVPVAGERVEIRDLEFEVVDMDNRRVDKVLVRKKGE